MKNINNFTQWKNGSVDVTFMRAITHQKHLAQSGHSTRSAVDIFNTLRVFTKEPIREQEIKLECMNSFNPCDSSYFQTVMCTIINYWIIFFRLSVKLQYYAQSVLLKRNSWNNS